MKEARYSFLLFDCKISYIMFQRYDGKMKKPLNSSEPIGINRMR